MAEKVARTGIKREKGFLYYLDKQGDVSKVKMARGGKGGGKPSKIAKCNVKREEGFLYFIDKQGDVSRAKMARKGGGRKRMAARKTKKKSKKRR